jgi:hypothetical protein
MISYTSSLGSTKSSYLAFLPFWPQAAPAAFSRFLFWPQWNDPLADQFIILFEDLNRKPHAPLALDKFNPPYIKFIVIPDTTFISINGRDESNPFIITQLIRRNTKLFTHFRDLHDFTSRH